MTIERMRDELEPFYDHFDSIVEDCIRPKVTSGQFKYFEACRFKLKSISYIKRHIEELDNKYKKFLSLCISQGSLDKLTLRFDETWGEGYSLYFPFFEALEFENLLAQGKACLDCFSKAIGSFYHESPNNITKLINILKKRPRDAKIEKILNIIQNKQRLNGVIINPNTERKNSLRDLITHRERVDLFFTIRMDHDKGEYALSHGALVNMRHPAIKKLQNYRVTEISSNMYFYLLNIIENCFKELFDISDATYANG
ncbi:MAG: hypothetical protein MUP30_11745 [Deltaproteobacteria bacterium]|nr:hypothetical protein [Deltaproteobacteria bacterium]